MQSKPKILIVDDIDNNLLALEALLDGLPVEVVKAHSGQEALEKSLQEDFALVLMDVQMPEMDGFEVVELMRSHKRTRYTPVIFISAIYKDEIQRIKGIERGAVDFITKPVIPEILTGKVRVFVDLHKQQKELEDFADKLKEANNRLKEEIEERQRIEEELRRSNGDLEQFAYAASHDLREPLRVIFNFVDLVRKRHLDSVNAKVLEYFEKISSAAFRMQDMIANLLEYSRIRREAKPFKLCSIEDMVNEALNNLNVTIKETAAEITLQEPLPFVMADRTQMIRVFQNLIGNSLKFCDASSPVIEIGAEEQGDFWIISVRDNGIGIKQEYFDRIFEIFQRLHSRSRYAGTGMGLAIVKRIIQQHGGQIAVESKPDEGSVFRIVLPKVEENPETTGENNEY